MPADAHSTDTGLDSAKGADTPRRDESSRSSGKDVPFFIGQNSVTVDDKGRFLIPAEVRKELEKRNAGQTLILVPGANGHPWLYAESYYEEHVAPRNSGAIPDDDEMEYMLQLFTSAARLVPDKAGRVLMPDTAIDREKLGRNCILLGVRDHLQLWPMADWEAFKARNADRGPELARRYKNKRPA